MGIFTDTSYDNPEENSAEVTLEENSLLETSQPSSLIEEISQTFTDTSSNSEEESRYQTSNQQEENQNSSENSEMLSSQTSTQQEETQIGSVDSEILNSQTSNQSQSSTLKEKSRKGKPNRKWIPKSVYRREKRKSLKKKVNIVHNFSSIQLTEAALSLLNKGLKFCPAQKGVNYTQLLADLFRLERKVAWKHHFKDEENENETTGEKNQFPFPGKKKKTNMPEFYQFSKIRPDRFRK